MTPSTPTGAPLNWISVLHSLYQEFPLENEPLFHFFRVEKKLQKELRLSRAVFFIRQKEGLRSSDKENPVLIPAGHPIFKQLKKIEKPLVFPKVKKGEWAGFWPVMAGSEWVACYGLGSKENGQSFTGEEKNLMELLADRTAFFLEEARLWSELEKANRQSSLGFLSAAMAHEIRNPLTALSTLVQMLPKKRNDDQFMESFQSLMTREIFRLTGLTETFLDFSKLNQEKSKVVHLNHLIDRVTQLLEALFRTRKVQLKSQTSSELLLKGDENQMEILIMNLLQNAFQSVASGGKVEIMSRYLNRSGYGPGPWIEISVKDNGQGIASENLNRIFDPFFSTKGEGAGLGLTICRKVVQSHQGFMQVKSRAGKGTVFKVFLPAEAGAKGIL